MTRPHTTIFETAPNEGTIHVCTTEELRMILDALPSDHVEGLRSVGLAPSTKKRSMINGSYFFKPEPKILIFAYPESLTFQIRMSIGRLRQLMQAELSFGMQTEEGDRWIVCRWTQAQARLFTLLHVLPHEIGHHVYRYHLKKPFDAKHYNLSEEFAEKYARDMRSRLSTVMK